MITDVSNIPDRMLIFRERHLRRVLGRSITVCRAA